MKNQFGREFCLAVLHSQPDPDYQYQKKNFKKCFSIIRDWFLNGTWIGCTASNAKESSVRITIFLLPYLYECGIDHLRSELDPDGNHPLVKEVQFHD